MNYFPILLNLENRPCLVVGGGGVGARKAAGLASAGARITVVSKEFLAPFAPKEQIICKERAYTREDVNGKFLVFAATNHARLNQEIAQDAAKAGALVCLADAPETSDFIVPARVQQGDLICTVSTSGTSPALAKKIRKNLQHQYGPEYARFLYLMKQIRKQMLSQGHDPERHREKFTALVNSDMISMIAAGNMEAVEKTIADILDDTCTQISIRDALHH